MRGRIAVRRMLLILSVAVSAHWARAQQPATPQPGAPSTTFKVSSRIVVLDVVVLNHDKPICGLTQHDFRVLENGKPQSIQHFEPHCAENGKAKTEPEMVKTPPLPPHTYENLPVTPATDSVTVLLIDALNTPISDNQYLRRQMLKYLKNMPPGRRIAIFALGSRLRLLQGFTTNSGQLLAAIASSKATPAASLLPSDNQNFEERQVQDWLTEVGASSGLAGFNKESDIEQAGMRVNVTLEAIDELARYLSGIPGRKNLIWFFGSFPVQFYGGLKPLPNGMGMGSVAAAYNARLKATADLLAAARVAVYPVSVTGAKQEPMFSAAQQTDYGKVVNGVPVGTQRFAKDAQTANMSIDTQHSAMDMLAKDTGGQAVYGSNALKQAVADAMNDGEHFYTITYAPHADFNGKWRKIQVSVDGKPDKGKYNLLYRHGYYATNSVAQPDTGEQSARRIFGAAMQDGTPAASQLLFQAKVVGRNLPPGPIAGQDRNLKDRAARYVIDYAIPVQNVDLTPTPQGIHTGKLYVEAVAYNDDGKVVNGTASLNSFALKPRKWKRIAQDRLQVHQVLDLPAGAIRLRLGVYDPATGNVGTIEIPLQVTPTQSAAASEAPRREAAPSKKKEEEATGAKAMSIGEMDQLLDRLHGQPDRKLVAELHDVRLTKRVSSATLASWEAEFPGSKARDTLMKLADLSAFQKPPAADVIGDPAPDRQTEIDMVTMAAHYVTGTMSRLPDFYATRVTTHFEDTLSRVSGVWFGEGTAVLHPAGVYRRTVTYRSGEEVPLASKGKRKEKPSIGLTSTGEFGPVLVVVLGDAIKNGIGFVRWEKGVTGPAAVFAYKVPAKASRFQVRFVQGRQILTMRPAYHGEIAIDSQTGAILRLTEIADMSPAHQKLRAAIEVDYAPVNIAGRSYILPVRSITFSRLPVAPNITGGPLQGTATDPNTWPIQTYMNDVAFIDYHQFRSTVRIIGDLKGQTTTPPKSAAPAGSPRY